MFVWHFHLKDLPPFLLTGGHSFDPCYNFRPSLGCDFFHNFHHCRLLTPATSQTMQCLGCNSIFKRQQGMIQHLSNRVLCQKAVGIEVPRIHPPTLSLPLEPVNTTPKHKNKKRPSAPQLSDGLYPLLISNSTSMPLLLRMVRPLLQRRCYPTWIAMISRTYF